MRLASITVWLALLIAAQAGVSTEASRRVEQTEISAYAETIPGTGVKFDMVPVPGGTFLMGSPPSEPGRASDEGPQHRVTIRPFWMGKLEVTWDEYDAFAFGQRINGPQHMDAQDKQPAKEADAVTRPTPPYADESFGFGKGRQPVVSITHHAAMEYCRWLSAKTGRTYRLPTEAEWEYACRAGTATAYSFGDDPKLLGEYGWHIDNADGRPRAGGRKKPNPWGLYDMHGNVAEWCLDHYDKDYYGSFKQDAIAMFPVLLPTERRYPHVARGGSWDDESPLLRSAARRASSKEWSKRDPQNPQSIWWHTEAIIVGLRVVRPLEEQENLRGLRSRVTRQSP